jgi:DNA relaxase NicK
MSDNGTSSEKPQDILQKLKSYTQPLVDSLDSKLRSQVDGRVDQKVEEILTDRLAVLERAVADLARAVKAIEEKLK